MLKNKNTWKLTEEQKQAIIDEYSSGAITCQALALKFNVRNGSICGILKRNNINIRNDQSTLQRKYKVNESFFEKINTEEKAYFLGWLYADGCNYEPSNNIIIVTQEGDKEILERLRSIIESERPLRFIKRQEKGSNRKNQYKLIISSKKISRDLSILGCFQNKSLTLKFPEEKQVPRHLLRHFIRGYFDGDGTIFFKHRVKKDGQKSFDNIVGFTSTKNFCLRLQLFLKEELNVFANIHDGNSETKITSNLYYSKRKYIIDICNFMYKDTDLFLKRKFDKYQELLKIINNK